MAYNVYHKCMCDQQCWEPIVLWLVKRIAEKLPSHYGSAIIRPYKSNFSFDSFKENS